MLPELKEIKKRRKALDLTQKELAMHTGLSRSMIARIEIEKMNPSYNKAKLIFDFLEGREKEAKTLSPDIIISQICERGVQYVEAQDKVFDVWCRMNDTAFSQFPVRSEGRIVGSISERAINRALMEGDLVKTRKKPIALIMEEPFPTLGADTPVAAVVDLLQHYQAVIVLEKGEVIGIATNTDIGKVFKLVEG